MTIFKKLIILICAAAFATFSLLLYCQAFYDFGTLAQERILISPLYAFFTTPLLFWVSAYLCRTYAISASGNNIENLEKALNEIKKGEKPSAFFSFKTIVICAISSLVATFGGGSLGREGPSIQIAAGIFFITSEKLKKFLSKINPETWIYAGVGTGLAIAFGTPFAGLICICEKSFNLKSRKIFSNFVWSIPAILTFTILHSKTAPLFATEQVGFIYNLREIALITLLAVICGLITIIFKKVSEFFYHKFVAIKSTTWHLIPVTAGLLVAIISAYYGMYSVGGGIKTTNDILANVEVFSSYDEVIARITTTILTFISGSAGGIVAPAIAIGGGIGSIASQLLVSFDPRIFILCGMSAFLGSMIGTPITAAMIIFETTDQPFSAFPFLLIASIIAFACTKIKITRIRLKS